MYSINSGHVPTPASKNTKCKPPTLTILYFCPSYVPTRFRQRHRERRCTSMPHRATTWSQTRFHTSDRSHHLDPITAVMRCCARAVPYRSHPAKNVRKSRGAQMPPGKHVRKSRIEQIPPGKHDPDRADHIFQGYVCPERSRPPDLSGVR